MTMCQGRNPFTSKGLRPVSSDEAVKVKMGGIDISAFCEQELDHVDVTVRCGQVERTQT